MPPKQKYSDPKLREEVKEDIKQSDKGGEPGQWSARKAQMMAKEYKKRGGDYNTPKSSKDESQKHLDKWNEEDWQTKEGSGEAKKDDGTRKRYLPKKAWDQMSEKEKEETDQKKQKESKEGKQFVGNTGKAKQARKTAQEDDNDDAEEQDDNDSDEQKQQSKSPRGGKTPKKAQGKTQSKSPAPSKQKAQQKKKDDDESASDEQSTNEKENESPSQDRKRTRSQKDDGKSDQEQTEKQKKQKTTSSSSSSSSSNNNNKKSTVGSKHDPADPPAKQGSSSRLPKKGQKNVHWKAMPGWVEGEVMEVVKADQDVDGKKVKASKSDPKVVLKSKSSGKVCVHKADNVYFD